MHGRWKTAATAGIVVLVSALAGLLAVRYVSPSPAPSLSEIAACFASSTKTTEATFPTQCLRATISSLLQTYSTQDILAYITSTSTPQSVTNVCHPIGHIVGEQTYAKYDSISQALAQCTSACRSACTHGVIGAGVLEQLGDATSGEDAAVALMNIASSSTSQLQQIFSQYCAEGSQICHGIGHVAFIATQDLPDSLGLCDKATATTTLREACYEGVFMERAGSYLNALFPAPDHVLPQPQADDYTYPCSSLQMQYRRACYIFLNAYQAPLFYQDGISTPQAKLAKASQVCESLSEPDRSYCFIGLGTSSSLFGVYTGNQKQIDTFCQQFPLASDQNACMLGVLPQFSYSQYRGLYAYCESQPNPTQQSFCYDATFEYVTRNTNFKDAQTICDGFSPCIPRYGMFLQEQASLPDYWVE